MRRTKRARVLGPYRHKRHGFFQVFTVGADGQKRVAGTFHEEAEAKVFVELCRRESPAQQGRTVEDNNDAYCDHLRSIGRRKTTVTKVERVIRVFMVDQNRQMSSLSISYLEELLTKRRESGKAVDTLKTDLRVVKPWLLWCGTKRGVPTTVLANLDQLKVEGASSQGKLQLTLDESRKYLAAALEFDREVGSSCDGPTVAILPLTNGLRDREILDRQVRDVDDGGRRLIVQRGKTRRSRRIAELPEVVQPLVQRWTEGKESFDLLFPGRHGKAHYNSYLQDWVRRICDRAGVPRVCPHGLRGTFSTLAEGAGVASHVVARELGHADDRVTGRHYTLPEVRQVAKGRRAFELIEGGQKQKTG